MLIDASPAVCIDSAIVLFVPFLCVLPHCFKDSKSQKLYHLCLQDSEGSLNLYEVAEHNGTQQVLHFLVVDVPLFSFKTP